MKEINWNEIVVDCDFHGWLCPDCDFHGWLCSDCIKAKEIIFSIREIFWKDC